MRHDQAVTLAKSIDAALLLLDDVRAATATGARKKIQMMTILRNARLMAWGEVGARKPRKKAELKKSYTPKG